MKTVSCRPVLLQLTASTIIWVRPWQKTGWVLLEDETDDPEYLESWFFFDNTGKRVSQNEVDKKINGDYYTFVDGRMQTGWFKLPASETAAGENAAEATLQRQLHRQK